MRGKVSYKKKIHWRKRVSLENPLGLRLQGLRAYTGAGGEWWFFLLLGGRPISFVL